MEGVLGETFSGRVGDYMVSCMARLNKKMGGLKGKREPCRLRGHVTGSRRCLQLYDIAVGDYGINLPEEGFWRTRNVFTQ
jgi:hypothetical protein